MKLLLSRTMFATLLLLGAHAHAGERPALEAINEKPISKTVMSLIPGIYLAGGWGEQPDAFAVRISQVSGNNFKGTIELIRLDKSGEVVRETSGLTGVMGGQLTVISLLMQSNKGIAPLTMQLQNGPLLSRMSQLEGNMSSTGFRLYWKLPSDMPGSSHGTFVLSTEDAYQQVLTRYSEISNVKKRLRADEASSAKAMEAQLNSYIQSADKWLSTPHGNELEIIESKVRALYAEQLKVMSGGSPDKAAAEVISIQIGAYESQSGYIAMEQEKQENFQRGSWFFLDEILQSSFCTDGTSVRLGRDVSPSCDGLPALHAAAEQRWNKVHEAQFKMFQRRQRVLEVIECFREAAEVPMEPNRGISPSCEKFTRLTK